LDSSLVNGLRSIYKNHWSLFCDLKISCGDGETVIAPKLILAVHSDYFSALLKHEPETTTISLPQFNSASVTFVIKSLVDFDENDLDDVELGQVVRVADYFQMKELVSIVSDVINTKLTTENLQDVIDLNQMIHSPNLAEGCVSFMKPNIQEIFKSQELLLQSLPKAMLLKTFSQPFILFKDQFGRQGDVIETTQYLFFILNQILTASGRTEDLPEFIRHCFKKDYLYFIFTGDYDKVFSPLFQYMLHGTKRFISNKENLANHHEHILPKKLDIEVPATVDFNVLNSIDLNKLVLSNFQKPEFESNVNFCDCGEKGKGICPNLTGTFEVGDHVILHEDEDFVREQFRITDSNGHVRWTEGLARPMLGKSYPVIPKEVCKNDSNWVGVPSNDLRYGNTWYYPRSTLRKDHNSPSVFPGATFHWAPLSSWELSGGYFGSHNDVFKTENHQRWIIEGQIRKINVKSRTWDDRQIIQGIQVFMENGETKAFGMDLHDTVRVDSLEVPVGEHIKEFVVRSGFYIDAIGFKTDKGKTLGLIGGNGGSFKDSGKVVKASDHYYIDGIQGLTVVTQDAPCICEIQFKYVIVPSSDLCPFRAIGKSQDSDSDDLHSNERIIRNLDYWDEHSDSDNSYDYGDYGH